MSDTNDIMSALTKDFQYTEINNDPIYKIRTINGKQYTEHVFYNEIRNIMSQKQNKQNTTMDQRISVGDLILFVGPSRK